MNTIGNVSMIGDGNATTVAKPRYRSLQRTQPTLQSQAQTVYATPQGKPTDQTPGQTAGPQVTPGATSTPTVTPPPQPVAPPVVGGPGPQTNTTQVGPGEVNPWQTGSGPPTASITDPVDVSSMLQFDAYTPGGDPRLTDAQGRTDAAGNALVGGSSYNDLVSGSTDRYRSLFGTATDQGKYGSELDAAVAGLNGRSRADIAKDYMDAFDLENQQGVKDLQRQVIQRSAAGGRLGMGDDQVASLRPFTDYLTRRSALAKQLAADTASGDIEDRFRRVGALSGLRGQEAGIASDLSGQNFARASSAAGYGGRDATASLNDRADRLNAATSLEDLIFGQGQQNRGEFRTERGFQAGQEQQGIENRIRQRELQNQELEARFRRGAVAAGIGGQGAPTLEEILRLYGGA